MTGYTGRYSTQKHAARMAAFNEGQFEFVPGSRCGKIRCTTCTGQGPSAYGFLAGSWMDKHMDGHTPCWCGRTVPTKVLNQHQRNRWHPTKQGATA